MVETERAFAKTPEDKGIREVLLTYLSDGAIVFRPQPIKGKPLYIKDQNIPGLLTWKPKVANILLARDIGYKTDPWVFRKDRTSIQVSFIQSLILQLLNSFYHEK